MPAPVVDVNWAAGTITIALAGPHHIGLVTDGGYVALPPMSWPSVPPSHRSPDEKPADYEMLEHSEHTIAVAHCAWQDRDGCSAWRSVTLATDAPLDNGFMHTQLTWFEEPVDPDVDLHQGCGEVVFERRHEYVPPTLRCTETGQKRREFTDAILGGDHFTAVLWIAAAPPVFSLAGTDKEVVFERCAPSSRYTRFSPRSDGFVAVYGRELLVTWRGQRVGTLPAGGTVVAWEPDEAANRWSEHQPAHPDRAERHPKHCR